jgi:hypothetical protein
MPGSATGPRHALTEEALSLLVQSRSSLSWNSAPPDPTVQGKRRRRVEENRRLESQTRLLRLVSVTEAYIDAMSVWRVSSYVDLNNPTQAQLLEGWELTSTTNWSERCKAYQRYHSIQLQACPAYQEVQAAVQLRNSITHGLGRITPRQRTKTRLSTEALLVDATVDDGRVHLGENTIAIAATACRFLVQFVDEGMPPPPQ